MFKDLDVNNKDAKKKPPKTLTLSQLKHRRHFNQLAGFDGEVLPLCASLIIQQEFELYFASGLAGGPNPRAPKAAAKPLPIIPT
jgi:hypothetical protein